MMYILYMYIIYRCACVRACACVCVRAHVHMHERARTCVCACVQARIGAMVKGGYLWSLCEKGMKQYIRQKNLLFSCHSVSTINAGDVPGMCGSVMRISPKCKIAMIP